jgi:hypothetical protein
MVPRLSAVHKRRREEASRGGLCMDISALVGQYEQEIYSRGKGRAMTRGATAAMAKAMKPVFILAVCSG